MTCRGSKERHLHQLESCKTIDKSLDCQRKKAAMKVLYRYLALKKTKSKKSKNSFKRLIR